MDKSLISAPIPTIRRLPKYIHMLKRLKIENVLYVSATTIAHELKIEPILVRKDLSITGIIGKPKVGFEVEELIASITQFLNWNNTEDAFIIGVGALGEAILGYSGFKDYGLNIIAGFDIDKKKIGKKIFGVEILPLDSLEDLIKRMHINIGVLTVPASESQEICDSMVSSGIKAIWNFSPIALQVPDEVILENVHLSQSLAVLTHKLAKKLKG
ncbi:MAG: redox-sensing transcriptional repressor Rex [Ignavibacteriae bacterium]|nr:redox-sensing transcriptional repressor Rex [Ignavibacteriota bacterium]NOG96350.1 redox-sensing transcriptional repressor Rex [Ignavibacteriota bacterium]